MERVNRILQHPEFIQYRKKITEAEKERVFCGHDLVHFLDVCRLAWILYLEDRIGLAKVIMPENTGEKREMLFSENQAEAAEPVHVHKEWIYAAGLLHDIGRWKEYEDGTDHARASRELVPAILLDCGFGQAEIDIIAEAIGNHRNKAVKEEKSLSGYLYRADKMSRACFGCRAEKICDWSPEKKNMTLVL